MHLTCCDIPLRGRRALCAGKHTRPLEIFICSFTHSPIYSFNEWAAGTGLTPPSGERTDRLSRQAEQHSSRAGTLKRWEGLQEGPDHLGTSRGFPRRAGGGFEPEGSVILGRCAEEGDQSPGGGNSLCPGLEAQEEKHPFGKLTRCWTGKSEEGERGGERRSGLRELGGGARGFQVPGRRLC